jgi:hypothetical protein
MQVQLLGLKPTRRHGLIFLLYVAIAVVAFVKLLEIERRTGLVHALPLAALYSPWLLGLLIIGLDRPGPVRNWLGPLVLSLFYPALGLWYVWDAATAWVRFGRPPAWHVVVPITVIVLTGFAAFLVRMYPRGCPKCEERSLIPLTRLIKEEKRSAKTWWCASCGAKLWKDREGQWQKERRKTWLDAAEAADAAPAQEPRPELA